MSRRGSINPSMSIHYFAFISVTPTGWISMKYGIGGPCMELLSRNPNTAKTVQIIGYYVKDPCTFYCIHRDKVCHKSIDMKHLIFLYC